MMALPSVDELGRITKSFAMLDLTICPELEGRYYSYDSRWLDTEGMASMRNGCGDDWFILFDESGAAGIKGFAHEYPAAREAGWVEQIMRALPPELSAFASEPAFHWDSTSFCYWQLPDDSAWKETPEQSLMETGASEFLEILVNPIKGYRHFASDYFEWDIDPGVIEDICSHRPVTAEIVAALNSEIGIDDIRDGLDEIGYPHQSR